MTVRSRPRPRSRRWRTIALVAPLTAATLVGTVEWAQAHPGTPDRARQAAHEGERPARPAAGVAAAGTSADPDGSATCLTPRQLEELRATVRALRAQVNGLGGGSTATPSPTSSASSPAAAPGTTRPAPAATTPATTTRPAPTTRRPTTPPPATHTSTGASA